MITSILLVLSSIVAGIAALFGGMKIQQLKDRQETANDKIKFDKELKLRRARKIENVNKINSIADPIKRERAKRKYIESQRRLYRGQWDGSV